MHGSLEDHCLVIRIPWLNKAITYLLKKKKKKKLRRNEEVYVSKEVKVNALDSHERANHSDQK